MDNIKIELGEIEWEIVEWILVAQDRDQWRVITYFNECAPWTWLSS
jgi:hypothetical protein